MGTDLFGATKLQEHHDQEGVPMEASDVKGEVAFRVHEFPVGTVREKEPNALKVPH